MNRKRPWWIVFSLLPPLFVIFGLIVPYGCGGGGGSSSTAAPTPGTVAIAFVAQPPEGNFRHVLVNISGVRLNQAVNAASNAPGWISIAVPSGVGSGNQQNPGDLQIDLEQTQTMATFFNLGGVPVGTYRTAQVLVDATLPGNIVPACPSTVSNTEGCTNYPINFDTSNPSLNSVIFGLSTPINVSANATAPLVIQLGLSVAANGFPINTGDPYLVDFSAAEANVGSYLGAVTGSITVKGSSSSSGTSPLTVSAELSGTNNIIESAPVKKKNAFTLELPAAPDGTAYDIFVTGGGDTYATAPNQTVFPGQSLNEAFTVTSNTITTFAGTVSDACTGIGIPGAQLELLAPPATGPLPSPQPTPPATGLCFSDPDQCVVVGSAFTDQSGRYPLPGTKLNPVPFAQAPTNFSNLAVRVSASGYSSLLSSAFLKSGTNQICSAATQTAVCNFSLTTGYINGTVNLNLDPPPGQSVMVEVFAENHGSNQIVGAVSQPLVFTHGITSLPFVPIAFPGMNVPIGEASSFDLVAFAIDPYLGSPSPFPGHEISVLADVPAPAGQCESVPPIPPSPNPTPTPIAMPAMDCVGQGSITGTVQNPDLGTYVEVEKDGVQVLGTIPGLLSSTSPLTNTQYSLCVPPDSYTLQRFEVPPTPTSSPTSFDNPTPTATPIAVGTPQPITVPQPASTSSPCPSSCSNSNTGPAPCPATCNATSASPL